MVCEFPKKKYSWPDWTRHWYSYENVNFTDFQLYGKLRRISLANNNFFFFFGDLQTFAPIHFILAINILYKTSKVTWGFFLSWMHEVSWFTINIKLINYCVFYFRIKIIIKIFYLPSLRFREIDLITYLDHFADFCHFYHFANLLL
jgi:hypothetical protein